LAWRWEGLGGMLALFGIVLSSFIELLWGSSRNGSVFLIWLLPSILFLFCWWKTKKL
jgi:hypothetical protein